MLYTLKVHCNVVTKLSRHKDELEPHLSGKFKNIWRHFYGLRLCRPRRNVVALFCPVLSCFFSTAPKFTGGKSSKKKTNKQTMWNWRVRITAPEIILCPIEYDDFRQKFRPKLCQSKKMFNFFESLLALPYRWCNFYYFVCTLIDHTELFTSWTHESSFCGILWA